jgi:hypothetical protein
MNRRACADDNGCRLDNFTGLRRDRLHTNHARFRLLPGLAGTCSARESTLRSNNHVITCEWRSVDSGTAHPANGAAELVYGAFSVFGSCAWRCRKPIISLVLVSTGTSLPMMDIFFFMRTTTAGHSCAHGTVCNSVSTVGRHGIAVQEAPGSMLGGNWPPIMSFIPLWSIIPPMDMRVPCNTPMIRLRLFFMAPVPDVLFHTLKSFPVDLAFGVTSF